MFLNIHKVKLSHTLFLKTTFDSYCFTWEGGFEPLNHPMDPRMSITLEQSLRTYFTLLYFTRIELEKAFLQCDFANQKLSVVTISAKRNRRFFQKYYIYIFSFSFVFNLERNYREFSEH